MSITIITDGSCDNANGKGGWAAILRTPSALIELTDWAEGTTSNRMELTAAVEGLRSIKQPSEVTIVTDSTYVLKTMKNRWYLRWFEEEEEIQAGRRKVSKARPNLDLWHQLVGLSKFHKITWIKVKGHSGDFWNNRVDRLADRARREKLAIKVEMEHIGDLRCHFESYGKQCFLYTGHAGECRFSRKEETIWEKGILNAN